ncbi:MAG: FAD-dependent oxidoreductase [Burkholderiaceae bacterium]|nr:FAD-dependent oxidoreductase [Burkholderiaceae bacterium]
MQSFDTATPRTATQRLSTTCCIAGGGPAGMMLGLLLARAGVAVTVLEKHADFLRDFRGDTIHPSTLAVVEDLDLLDRFLALPHQLVETLHADVYGHELTIADFRHLPVASPFLALMPQWDFLDFLAREAARWPGFRLLMDTEATGLIEEDGRITGLRAEGAQGSLEVASDLVVGADGRTSAVRAAASLATVELGAPMDVLWFRLPRDTHGVVRQTGGYVRPGLFLVTIDRGDYWQCGFVIAKGSLAERKARGLDAFKDDIVRTAPFLAEATRELRSWDEVKLLTVQVNRMPRWYRDGLLCIGDAAHAMSPVGGVGINLAIQDAVAAANRLAVPLRERRVGNDDLAAVQRRREWPTRVTQRIQIAVQNEVLAPVLARGADGSAKDPPSLPMPLRLLQRWPGLNRVPARMVGMGVRPERVRSPASG